MKSRVLVRSVVVAGCLAACACAHGQSLDDPLDDTQSLLPMEFPVDPPVPTEPMEAERLESSYHDESILTRYTRGSRLPRLIPRLYSAGPPDGFHYRARSLGWVQVDYLLWWLQGDQLPNLAVAPIGDVIVGGNRLASDAQNGVRVRGGYFFDCGATCGLMVDFFGFDSVGDRNTVDSSVGGAEGLVLPFTDMDLSLSGGCACLDDLEGVASSVPLDSLNVTSDTSVFSGGVYGRSRINSWFGCCQQSCCGCSSASLRHGFRWDVIYGYRYMQLDETLTLNATLAPATGVINATDVYRTENDFHGFDVGMLYEIQRGRWSLEMLGRVGLGINFQRLAITGSGNRGGGLFAQYLNEGEYEHDKFTVIPEVNLNLAYALTCNLRARFGYSFLLLTNVIRPGDQIDTRIDGRFFDATESIPLTDPLAFFPTVKYETESMWLQGLNFGLEYWF